MLRLNILELLLAFATPNFTACAKYSTAILIGIHESLGSVGCVYETWHKTLVCINVISRLNLRLNSDLGLQHVPQSSITDQNLYF